MHVYFDNAATTPIYPQVVDLMADTLRSVYGNPSSVHHFGRLARVKIEKARRTVAELMNVSPAEIFFNSGGTEGINAIFSWAVHNLGVKRIVTSPIEHPAVLNTAKWLEKKGFCEFIVLKIDEKGYILTEDLENILHDKIPTLVSLMHGNNEIGNLLSIKEISSICRKYDAFFHSDMVQTVGHYSIDLQAIDVDFITASAHKFHGPKGVGFVYVNGERIRTEAFIHGGAQERNMRAGTENLAGIVGLSEALKISLENLEEKQEKVREIKTGLVEKLKEIIPNVEFLGDSATKGLYTVLSVAFPPNEYEDMLVANLDIEGVAASMGSACSSGTTLRSHVVEALNINERIHPIRFSFSHMNTLQEVEFVVNILKKLFDK